MLHAVILPGSHISHSIMAIIICTDFGKPFSYTSSWCSFKISTIKSSIDDGNSAEVNRHPNLTGVARIAVAKAILQDYLVRSCPWKQTVVEMYK